MANYKIIAYLADWEDWKVEDIDAHKLTHLNYAFATIDNGRVVEKVMDKGLTKIDLLRDVKAKNPNLKTLISIGGWGADGFSNAALTEKSRALFAETAVEFMKKYDFDGVDIDWEYPCSSSAGIVSRPEDRENFTLLLRDTRKKLDEVSKKDNREYLLTIAVGAGQYFIDGTQMSKVQDYLDFINIMTYDLASGFDTKTGHHTNIYGSNMINGNSGSKAVELFMGEGIPTSKLVLGAAFYGRAWSGVDGKNNGLGQPGNPGVQDLDISYSNISRNLINKNTFTKYWDDQAKAPYLYNGDIFISYEDEESLGYKVDYIKKMGLGGIMFWEYSLDNKGALLDVLYNGLR